MPARERCPVCGNVAAPAGVKVGAFRRRPYALAACGECGAAWVTDADEDVANLYNADYYRGAGADPLVDYATELTDPHTTRVYEWRGLARIAADAGATRGCTWIDFGAGAGGLARFLRAEGYAAQAFDTGYGIELARQHGVPVVSVEDLDALDGRVDVVSAIEVAEHVFEPRTFFARIARLLAPGGLLVLTTGNVERHRAALAEWGYVVPEVHVTYYAPRTLERLYAENGLEPARTGRSAGWNDVIRYKVLKTLRISQRNALEAAIPWSIVAPLVDSMHGVSAMPLGRKR